MSNLLSLARLLVLLAVVSPSARAQSGLAVIPSQVDFETLLISECGERQVMLVNPWDGEVIVDSVWVEAGPSPFYLSEPPLPDTITRRDSVYYTIRFCPGDTTYREQRVHMRYHLVDSTALEATIVVTGQGMRGSGGGPIDSHSATAFRLNAFLGGWSLPAADTMLNIGDGAIRVTGVRLTQQLREFIVFVGYDSTRGMTGTLPAVGSFPFPVDVTPAGRFVVAIRFNPTVRGDTNCFFDTLVIESDLREMRLPVEGCINMGELVVERVDIDFGNVVVNTCAVDSIRVVNVGNAQLTIRASGVEPTNGPFTLLDSTALNPVDSIRAVVSASSSRLLNYRFCPIDVGPFEAHDTIEHDGLGETTIVRLRGNGIATRATWSGPTELNFGDVTLGTSSTETVAVRNVGLVPQTVSSVVVNTGVTNPGFFLVSTNPPVGDLVLPGNDLSITIRFTPVDESLVQTALEIEPSTPRAIAIQLRGRGRIAQPEERYVRLDSTSGTVGEALELRVVATRALKAQDGRRLARLRLRMSPTSFYPLESPGWRILRRTRGDVIYERTDTTMIVGLVLARVLVRPLSTARSLDTIQLTEFAIDQEPTTISAATVTISLEGCDLGREVGLARAVRISGISMAPGAAAILEYRAPAGSIPIVRIVDRSGTLLGSLALPQGTDAPQQFPLDLQPYPPGMLLVELVVEEQRITIPIMHHR
jgi:hypothetical protein